ncbi:MAG: hypothetical protein LBM77_12625 [Spirochaetaceae bacterium]|jgi:hypothetical protein|nr:hypothetical protein [Spirochaetaceae bacterium]
MASYYSSFVLTKPFSKQCTHTVILHAKLDGYIETKDGVNYISRAAYDAAETANIDQDLKNLIDSVL